MADPATLTLATLGTTVVVEGVKFLYGQAGELLKRFYDREQQRSAGEGAPIAVSEKLPEQLDGGMISAEIAPATLAASVDRLDDVRSKLLKYLDGSRPFDLQNDQLLTHADELRNLLGELLRRPIYFQGERQPAPQRTMVQGEAKAEEVSGKLTGVQAGTIRNADVKAKAEAGTVNPGGKVTAVSAGVIASSS